MKKLLLLIPLLLSSSLLTSCSNESVIKVSASIVPHAKILNEAIAPILKEEGYELKVKTLNWSIQNDSLLHNEYDANYFQHTPFLNAYEESDKLAVAAKVHYEKLCMYYSPKDENKKLDNGETIELVNDISNVERALKLLEQNGVLTINESNYVNGEFKNFDTVHPNKCVTFAKEYDKCSLVCIAESNLCLSLPDYNFGIIPGNTALLGLDKNFADTIVMSETVDEETISKLSNVIAVKKDKLDSPKTKALVKAFDDSRVKKYIEDTFKESVLYTFESLL